MISDSGGISATKLRFTEPYISAQLICFRSSVSCVIFRYSSDVVVILHFLAMYLSNFSSLVFILDILEDFSIINSVIFYTEVAIRLNRYMSETMTGIPAKRLVFRCEGAHTAGSPAGHQFPVQIP
jgi:hypothetical protein